jgi:hypothetical protein
MKKILLITILFSILGFTYLPQINNLRVKNEPQIIWSTSQLTWNDFQRRMKKSALYDAVTLSAISNGFSSENSHLNFIVKALFFPKDSKKKANKLSSELLKHEQGHFDITEIYARKLRQSLQATRYKNYKYIGKEVQKVYDQNNLEWRQFQNLYDKETDHSKNTDKQLKWNENIQELLIELDNFKRTEFKIDISYLK